ncbi:hypothetical protein KC321_g42 [Hortaea werneckii]|nr:hypothetical protein KC321_g42 [Hortaea werneckii]
MAGNVVQHSLPTRDPIFIVYARSFIRSDLPTTSNHGSTRRYQHRVALVEIYAVRLARDVAKEGEILWGDRSCCCLATKVHGSICRAVAIVIRHFFCTFGALPFPVASRSHGEKSTSESQLAVQGDDFQMSKPF